MQTNINIPVAEMLPLIKEKIENGGIAEMTVTGDSMLPLLIDRVSSVRLIKPERLKRGDIVLFQRSNGALVLHSFVISRSKLFFHYLWWGKRHVLRRKI